jgi:hypothetical protein
MFKFNKGTKVGMSIAILAFVAMIVLVLMGKPILNPVFYVFVVGLAISIVSAFVKRKR